MLVFVQAVIVGAGASGILHALALRAAGVRIEAVFDPSRERARSLSDACGARAVDSMSEAAATETSIAAICSPPRLHVEQAEMLATRGRTVFVEKPVALTTEELERLRTLRCVPILQWRAGRALGALRRAVAYGEFGDAPVVSCDLAWARSDAYFESRRHWGCGALLSIGIHALDAIVWALGREIDGVAGMTSSSRTGVDGETAAALILRMSGGAMATVRLSLDGGSENTRIAICGAGKTGLIEGGEADPTAGVVRWWASSASDRERLQALERETPGALGSPLLVPYLGAAIRAVRDGESPGQSKRLPSVVESFGAHVAAMYVASAKRSSGEGRL